ncbi:MAG: methionine synthase, partial [Calditrichaeota bacterium]|nr:methionine synthase [Calditrichota bacterium]
PNSKLKNQKSKIQNPKFIMGSLGPGTKSITITGGITFDEVEEAYYQYAAGLLEGGVDLLVLETQQDTLNVKASLLGIQRAQADLDCDIPVGLSATIETSSTMLAGQDIEALYHTISGFGLAFLGLNCATGPEAMTDHLRALAAISRFPVSVWANAGLPDENGHYAESPDAFATVVGRFAREGWLNIAGGCCGTTPQHIRILGRAVQNVQPRPLHSIQPCPALAGNEALVLTADNRPVFIGERTNAIGSRQFKRLIEEGKFSEAADIGRQQQQKGAMALDLCCSSPDRDELSDFLNVLKSLLRKVHLPLFIDTTDIAVVEAALKNIVGKPAINSVNLEDGGLRLIQIAKLAKRYGAALVCGLIDDDPVQGMAITLTRKLNVAGKIYRILKDELSISDTDIIFDPLTFPAGSGDPAYLGAAQATIDGIRHLKERYPHCPTLLGISNVSFGLPPAGRETLNSVFLYMASKAGLDYAIVNTQGLRRYPTIPPHEIELAARLLLTGSSQAIADFNAFYRTCKVENDTEEWEHLPIEEQISRAIVEARRTNLQHNLRELLKRNKPLEIINGPLLRGMDEVGRLFAENRLIIAEVLESAEVMKAAVDYLRQFMPPTESTAVKGKVLLATVKGDVHDIGKNLVDMILSNNGFEVINLGIKVAPEKLIEEFHRHQPDIIGLSGLLVRSAHQMAATAEDLKTAEINVPLLVGGAALSEKFTSAHIAPVYNGRVFYAAEAMKGLALANQILEKAIPSSPSPSPSPSASASASASASPHAKWIATDVPEPPDYDAHILREIGVDKVLPYVNESMLYGRHLGTKNIMKRLNDAADGKMNKLRCEVNAVIEEAVGEGIIAPKAIYRWFEAHPDGESIIIRHNDASHIKEVRFSFPRQQARGEISAVDWLRPPELGGDNVCLFVVASGLDTGRKAASLRQEGRLLASHILQAVALEIAEAAAEWLHKRIRAEWGFADPPELTVPQILHAKYRGARLSFGYPACPQIEDQKPLFELLQPEQIGVELTESYMMQPESAVSAVVFHHPKAKHYAV